MTYPHIDPVAFHIGSFGVHWYGIAYVAGIILGWQWCVYLLRKGVRILSEQDLGDFISWAVLGIIAGGRLGHVLFYGGDYYWHHPLEILQIWNPGMSFHGGFLGVVIALVLYTRARKIPLWSLADVIACGTPLGILFGRIANFINGELYGRITDSSLGMVFPGAGPLPRHPSQLYEGALEGLLLWIVLNTVALSQKTRLAQGRLAALFLMGYGVARYVGEFFREPEVDYGALSQWITYGQLLTLPLIAAGIILYVWAGRRATTS
jgi:phosphatidylglycerol:prolipoprotein diacylglycerol transferase